MIRKRSGAVVTSIALMTTLVVGTPSAFAAPLEPKKAQRLTSVPGKPVDVKPLSVSTAEELRTPPRVTWPSVGSAEVTLNRAAQAVQAGGLPVKVAGAEAAKVRVEVLGQDESAKAGIAGLVVRLARTDGARSAAPVSLSVDYNGFRHAYGGDWASRLRLVPLNGAPAVGKTHNNHKAGVLSAEVPATDQATTFAVAAAPEGATGDYKATSLSPSAEWQVSQQNGSFSWNYPMRVPPVPGDLVPALKASYDSGSVDGRVATTNNQTSSLGEGWTMSSSGFIERGYKACAEDPGNQGSAKTGDLCWATENATLSMEGHSGALVKEAGTRFWRLKNDDGSRIEQFWGAEGSDNGDDNREYWRMTTTDGTQYTFGLHKIPGRGDTNSVWTVPVAGNNPGEPCNQSTYDASFCKTQAYRWNLDYVKDRQGNTMIYTYDVEVNKYGRNLGKFVESYTRSGNLRTIEYGTVHGVGGEAPAKVEFTLSDRCLNGPACTAKTPANWPDVPWDRDCSTATCGQLWAPTFWATKRLTAVTTKIKAANGYDDVERWTFDQGFPLPGDNTSPALWLKAIGHTGLIGDDVALPSVTFVEDPNHKGNRVDAREDGLPPGNKNRIHHINTESGGQVVVNYKELDCAPNAFPPVDTNTLRCFPVRWAPDKSEPFDDWFHKRVVSTVALVDRVGGGPTQFTSYDYHDGAAWAYRDDPLVDPKFRTWSDWRGYAKVTVRKGDAPNPGNNIESVNTYRYFRGMNGDKRNAGGPKSEKVDGIADDPQLAGFMREEITYDGAGGPEVKGTISTPWVKNTGTHLNLKSHIVKIGDTFGRTALAGGGQRRTETHTTYDGVGQPLTVSDLGDMADPNDDQCVTTTYVMNVGAWLLSLPSRITEVGVACGATATYPRDAISDTQSYYDGLSIGQATKGNVTKVDELAAHNGTPQLVTTKRTTYDSYGRAVDTFDAMDRKTSKAYTQVNGLVTASKETNALGHVTTSTIHPAYGSVTSVEDSNSSRTDTTYDALGRVTAVWAPGRSKASGQGPTSRFGYGVRNDGATWTKTESLKPNSNYLTSYQLFDGFMRERQTQAPSPQGGRVLTDKVYDTRGLVAATNAPYFNDSQPGTTLFAPQDNQIPNQTVISYDGAERKVKETYEKHNDKQWSTLTEYFGDRVKVTPPAGGTPTETYTNARGLDTEVRQFADGGVVTTKRSYTKAGELAKITDAVGNVWTNDYDAAGRKVSTADPDKGSATMTYNALGEVVTTKDARGQVTWRAYDALGRQTELRKDSATGELLASWTYDTIKEGQLTSTTRYVGGKAYVSTTDSYDAAYRPLQISVTVPDTEGPLQGTYKTNTTYLADGSVGSVALPALGTAMPSETVVYTYDAFGLPKATKANNVPVVSATTYTALGEVTQIQQGPDGKRAWQTVYYEEGTRRLSDSLVERETATDVQADQTNYSYDPIGNVKKIETKTAGSSLDRQCMAYDGMRRLRDAWTSTSDCAAAGAAVGGPAPYWNSYQPDMVGRRVSQTQHGINGAPDTTTTTTYPQAGQPQPHAPATVSVSGPALRTTAAAGEFDYDKAGNTVSKPNAAGAQQYTWDAEGQLASVNANGVLTEYVNTPDNTRLLAKQPGSATLYLPSGELKLDKATNKLTGTRYYLHGDSLVAAKTGGSLSYLTGDRQGTGTLSVNANTLATTKRRFDPFGVARGPAPESWPSTQGFVGGTADPATGLTRLGVRDYDPALGRFLSVDPLLNDASPQSLDAYVYSRNNPSTFSDPSGEMDWEEQKAMQALKLDSQGRHEDAANVRRQIDQKRNGIVTGNKEENPRRGTTITNQKRKEAKHRQQMYDWRREQARKRERARVVAREVNKLAKRHVMDEQDDRWTSILTDGIGSGSVCGSFSMAAGEVGVSREECVNFDNVGITYSAQIKIGVQFGFGIAADLTSKVNADKADQVASGITLSGEVGVHAKVGPGVDFGYESEKNLINGGVSDSIAGSAGWGAELSLAAGWLNGGVNTGYIIRWDPVRKPTSNGPNANCHPTLC
ncbi:hypothetical protein ALI144C_28370 [Actinosynnema sp. ALI-1.44]|uniref:RHS repeat domain-containing protein n=1 Tax=Actinosynnema sp. ALI-1.44 TaxID=1933779 RepID=UPI00097C9719|nr:RHS repeat-associated core domain-containing protein [Actinosynnema sp. ALI-1.44]ONI78710.1 hypothetical protein ALI144C_28370 [Actinosynnema sp. ALI-1.44]